jgi:hypothetical protein
MANSAAVTGFGRNAAPHNHEEPVGSDFRLLRQQQGIFDFDAKVSDRVLDFGMTKQNLHCT